MFRQVLLIHDPKADKEAAAMDVRVGSLCDPPNLLGLAHFCEHMLFLGSGESELASDGTRLFLLFVYLEVLPSNQYLFLPVVTGDNGV